MEGEKGVLERVWCLPWAGLPARTSCSSAASLPGWALAGSLPPTGCAPHTGLAQLLGPRGWSVVSPGVTITYTNFLWGQAQDPSPHCIRGQTVQAPRKDVGRVLRRFRDARPTFGLGVIAQLAKWKKKGFSVVVAKKA